MHLHVFSDLHADMADTKPIAVLPEVNVVVVAGDVCEGAVLGFERLREMVLLPTPIVMVMGNHEYYHRTQPHELALARGEAARFGVHLLENDAVVIGGVRFVGCTLWTDYAIFGPGSQMHTMAVCRDRMNDHRRITWRKQPWLRFRPQEALGLHRASRTYLTGLLETPFDGPTVVVTHHAPRLGLGRRQISQRPRHRGLRLGPFRAAHGDPARALGARSHPYVVRLPDRYDARDLQSARLWVGKPGL